MGSKRKFYNNDFYNLFAEGSKNSARVILSEITDIIEIKSVIDIGCGIGTWLSVCKELGVDDILGVDGDYVDTSMLLFPKELFIPYNLNTQLQLERKFDLVISLEVGEHLLPKKIDNYIKTLTSLSDIILFSAAIPFQAGENHINCQWPEYWVDLFAKKDYLVIDSIRKKVWNNPAVEHWYAQNIFLFVNKDYLAINEYLSKQRELTSLSQLSIVHPKRYLEIWGMYNSLTTDQHRKIAQSVKNTIKELYRKFRKLLDKMPVVKRIYKQIKDRKL